MLSIRPTEAALGAGINGIMERRSGIIGPGIRSSRSQKSAVGIVRVDDTKSRPGKAYPQTPAPFTLNISSLRIRHVQQLHCFLVPANMSVHVTTRIRN